MSNFNQGTTGPTVASQSEQRKKLINFFISLSPGSQDQKLSDNEAGSTCATIYNSLYVNMNVCAAITLLARIRVARFLE